MVFYLKRFIWSSHKDSEFLNPCKKSINYSKVYMACSKLLEHGMLSFTSFKKIITLRFLKQILACIVIILLPNWWFLFCRWCFWGSHKSFQIHEHNFRSSKVVWHHIWWCRMLYWLMDYSRLSQPYFVSWSNKIYSSNCPSFWLW